MRIKFKKIGGKNIISINEKNKIIHKKLKNLIELLQFYKIKSCKKKEKFLWKEKIKYKIIYIIKKEKI